MCAFSVFGWTCFAQLSSHLFGFWGLESPVHLFVLALIILLLFGNRLPSVMRSLGQGVVEFKKGLAGIEDEVKNATNSTNKIEEQPTKPQATEEAKAAEAEPTKK
jgi:sec-independent protein translocase protein TatA